MRLLGDIREMRTEAIPQWCSSYFIPSLQNLYHIQETVCFKLEREVRLPRLIR